MAKYKKIEESFNYITGEVQKHVVFYQTKKVRSKEFVMSITNSGRHSVKWMTEVSSTDIAVLNMLVIDADFKTHLTNNKGKYNAYAGILGCQSSTIKTAIYRMIRMGYIARANKDEIMVNPMFLYKGSADEEEYEKALVLFESYLKNRDME